MIDTDSVPLTPAVRVFAPSDCTAAQLAAFESALIAAGEKASPMLGERIRRAACLAFVSDEDRVAAVGALKCPKLEHRAALFKRAFAEVPPEPFDLELGWLTGKETEVPLLVSALAGVAGARAVYAIVQANEATLQAELLRLGFRAASPPYPSSHGDYSNQIHIRGE